MSARGPVLGAAAAVVLAVIVGVWFWRADPELGAEPEFAATRIEPSRSPTAAATGAPGVAASPERSVIESLGAGAWIRGRVSERGVGPLAEGRVELRCEDGELADAATIDPEGTFAGRACAAGPTCVRLLHPGVEQPRAWEVEPESDAALELEVDSAATLAGTVVDREGDPVAAAELVIRRGSTRIAVGSDVDGAFAVAFPRRRPCDRCDPDVSRCRGETDEAPEHAVVLAMAPGFAPTEITASLDGAAVELVLDPAAPALTGIVVGRAGEPFDTRTRVLAINRAREHERHAALVDERGRFGFEGLADASYSLRAIRDEREIAALESARPGEDVELRSDHGARGSTLELEIVDAEGEPVAGARVDGGPLRAAVSDAEGRVTATTVLPGTYTLRVRISGCDPVREAIELEPKPDPSSDVQPWVRRIRVPRDFPASAPCGPE